MILQKIIVLILLAMKQAGGIKDRDNHKVVWGGELLKTGVCKGGKVVLVSDVDRICPCTYVHKKKLWDLPAGFKMEVPNEVRIIMEKLDKMIIDEGSVEIGKTRKIFKNKSSLCWYNYFSGDNMFDHAGKKGYFMLSTVRCDRLPK